MPPISTDPCHAPRSRGGSPVAASGCAPIRAAVPAVVSDAILKPRPIFVDGFGLGAIPSIGFTQDLDTIPQPATTFDAILDPISGAATGITSYSSVSRYGYHSGRSHILATAPPIDDDFPSGIEIEAFYERWEYVATGGAGGAGYIVSRADNAAIPNGNWLGVPFRSSSPTDAGSGVFIFDLNGMTIPADGLNVIAFVGQFVTRPNAPSSLSPIFGLTPHVVVVIRPDRRLELRRLDVTTVPGTPPTYAGEGTWAVLATSDASVVVPATGVFGIEPGMFLSSRDEATDQHHVANGFAFARLYHNDVVGVAAVVALNVPTRGFTDEIVGVAFGSDVRDQYGDGAGNVSSGYDGLRVHGVIACDNAGAVRTYLYGCLVGTALPAANGAVVESTPTGGTPLANASRLLEDVTTMVAAMNRLAGVEQDEFTLAAAQASAREILAVLPAKYSSETFAVLGGEGKILVRAGSAEVSAHQSNSRATAIDEQLVIQSDPETGDPILPADISTRLRLAAQNDAPTVDNGDWVILQLALEYIFRERVVTAVEHPPFAPICTFGSAAEGVVGNAYRFQDTSVSWDSAIVSRAWTFGDAGTSTDDNPLHTWATPGTFTVTLTVTDANGLTATASVEIVVPNQLPTANFSSESNADDEDGLTVDFTDASSDPDGTIEEWLWDFGDGETSTEQNPTHAYAEAGTYPVSLIVTDNSGGASAPAVDNVTVPPPAVSDPLCVETDADAAFSQGNNFNGDIAPFSSYANTAAYDADYLSGARRFYTSAFDSIQDGISHFIDAADLFNAHKTLAMTYGDLPAPVGHPRYVGAGWRSVPTDNGSPVETLYTVAPFGPTGLWGRAAWKAEAGVVSDVSATSQGEGLRVVGIAGRNISIDVFVRSGHVYLEIGHKLTNGGGFTIDTIIDLGLETTFVGGAGYGDLILRYEGDNAAHTMDVRAWVGAACTLGGVSPSYSDVLTAHIGTVGSSLSHALAVDDVTFFDNAFTPTGANKVLHVGYARIVTITERPNPWNVALI